MKRAFLSRRAIFLAPLLLVFAFCSLSCKADSAQLSDRINSAFSSEIRITHGDVCLYASLSVSSVSPDMSRDIRLCFSSPEAVSGMTLETKDGKTSVSFNGFSLPCDTEIPISREICEMFTVSVGMTLKESLTGGEILAIADGDTEIIFDKSARPLSLSRNGVSVEILSFSLSD